MRLSIKLDATEFQDYLKNAFDTEIKKTIKKATRKCALYLVSEIVKRIKSGKYEKLSEWTAFLKKLDGYSDLPLVRRGALLRSITHEMADDASAEIGLLLQTREGDSLANIGKILHDGARIPITEDMRRAFGRKIGAILSKHPGVELPKKKKSSVIIIPKRPFIRDVFEDPQVVEKIKTIYIDVFKESLKA